eukprot:148226_1
MANSLWTIFVFLVPCYYHQMNAFANPMTEPAEIVWMNNKTIGKISCNQTIIGSTTLPGDVAYYSLINTDNENGTYFQIDTCGSEYDTTLYLFDQNLNEIVFCDDCGSPPCDKEQIHLPMKLYDDRYIIGVGGYSHYYGNYTVTIHCDSNQSVANQLDCTVNNNTYICKCSGYGGCNGAIIKCKDDMDCILNCNGSLSCKSVPIIWPSNGTGALECNGDSACANVNFPEPSPFVDLIVTCDSPYECYHSRIICPKSADCIVKCNEYYACSHTDIQWPLNGTGTLECHGYAACYYAHFPEPPSFENYHILCDDFGTCAYATILCPEFAQCTVECTDDQSCVFAIIQCPTHAECIVKCSILTSCISTTILWSKELVKSTLECPISVSRCSSAKSIPPEHYEYVFDEIYDLTQYYPLQSGLFLSEEFTIEFNLQILKAAGNEILNIIKIFDESTNQKIFTLSLDIENDFVILDSTEHSLSIPDEIAIMINDGLIHTIKISQTQKQQTIAFNGQIFTIFKSQYSLATTTYSAHNNNQTYSIEMANNPSFDTLDAYITNVTVNMDLFHYFETKQENQKQCSTKPNDSGLDFILPIPMYWNETLFVFEGWYATWTDKYEKQLYYRRVKDRKTSWNSVDLFEFQQLDGIFNQWTQIFQQVYFISDGSLYSFILSPPNVSFKSISTNSVMPEMAVDCCLCNNETHLFMYFNYTMHSYNIEESIWNESQQHIHVYSHIGCELVMKTQTIYIFG